MLRNIHVTQTLENFSSRFLPCSSIDNQRNNSRQMKASLVVEIIRLSKKFLSCHKVIIDEQQFLFYIILLN